MARPSTPKTDALIPLEYRAVDSVTADPNRAASREDIQRLELKIEICFNAVIAYLEDIRNGKPASIPTNPNA